MEFEEITGCRWIQNTVFHSLGKGNLWVSGAFSGVLVLQFMRVKLPSVSKWGRIVPTDVAALNGIRLLLHGRYIMQITTIKEVKSGERQKGTDR